MEVESSIAKGSIENLLAEQRLAVERALAFNHAITERLATQRLMRSPADEEVKKTSVKSSKQPKAKPTFEIDDKDSSLSKPLLSNTGMDADLSKSLDSKSLTDSDEKQSKRAPSKEHLLMKMVSEKDVMSWHMFPTLQNVKQLVEEALNPAQKPGDLYQDRGFWSWLAQTPLFNTATLLVIVFNTLWIAYDTDYNPADLLADADIQFQIAGHFFCSFFTCEIIVRLLSFKNKCVALTDYWFVFEMFLVALMIWETWISLILHAAGFSAQGGGVGAGSVLRIFRIFRLLRVARTARLLSSVPELMILAKGMFVAMRSVMVTLSLLALIIYIFAIVFTQLLAGIALTYDNENPFKTVPSSANFLLLQVLCGFDASFAQQVLQKSLICYFLFLVYILLGSLTIMNMLIGILCDVVFTVANDEKEETFQREMERKVEHLAQSLDVQGRGRIARGDFEQVFKRPEVILSLTELGVDVAALMDFAHFVFQENEDISLVNWEHMVVQFRGGKNATVKDVMNMRKQMSSQLSKLLHAYEAHPRFGEGGSRNHYAEHMSDAVFDEFAERQETNKAQIEILNPAVNMDGKDREFENPFVLKERCVEQGFSQVNTEERTSPIIRNSMSPDMQNLSSSRQMSPDTQNLSSSRQSCLTPSLSTPPGSPPLGSPPTPLGRPLRAFPFNFKETANRPSSNASSRGRSVISVREASASPALSSMRETRAAAESFAALYGNQTAQ